MNYIIQYLNEKSLVLTHESPLFSARDNPNKEINTKNVSRTFTKIANTRLYSLHRFFQKNAKHYLSELKKSTTPKDDEYYRKLYELDLPNLEIELPMEMRQLRKQQQKELETRDREVNALKETVRKLQPLLEWLDSTEPEIAQIRKELGIGERYPLGNSLHSYNTLQKAKAILRDDAYRKKLAQEKGLPITKEE